MKGREWYQEFDIAEEYDEKRFSRGGRLIDRREKDAVLESVGSIDDRDVLEIACGTGRFSVMLAANGANVVGLDISDAMLAQGRRKAAELEIDDRLEFIRGDASRLPFPDNHFDIVLAMRFFHLMPEPAVFLEELERVTRDQLVFDTFNARSFRRLYTWLLPMGSRLYTGREVRRLLADSDLYLEGVRHDFIVPFGVYRAIPKALADAIYAVDRRALGTGVGEGIASVSYWSARATD